MKADSLQKIEDLKNDGVIDMDGMISALGNYFSGRELEEFVEFLEKEYSYE